MRASKGKEMNEKRVREKEWAKTIDFSQTTGNS